VRIDLAIQRAMAKDPADRFDSMDDFVAELEGCLAELDGRGDEGATMIVPARRAPRRRASGGSNAPVMPALLLALVAAAIAAGAFLLLHDGGTGSVLSSQSSSKSVRLSGVTAFDPEGDNSEHGAEAGNATDKNRETYWQTEHYRDFAKGGVGLVLQAPGQVDLSRMTVVSDGGFKATIKASDSPDSGFEDVSQSQQVGETTTFKIDAGKKYRYYMVWLTLPREGGQARIREVTAKT
jgi:hypothetical protein